MITLVPTEHDDVLEIFGHSLHLYGRSHVCVMGSGVVGAVKSTIITFILLLSGTHLRFNY